MIQLRQVLKKSALCFFVCVFSGKGKAETYIIKYRNPPTKTSYNKSRFTEPLNWFDEAGLLENQRAPQTSTLALGHFKFISSPSDSKFLQTLGRDPNIEYIEKDVMYYPLSTDLPTPPTDPNWKNEWQLYNNGQNNWEKGPEGEDVQALKAWSLTQGSEQVLIAVIDSGVDITHPDLQENIFINLSEKNGQEGIDDDHNGFIDDIHGWNFFNDNKDVSDLRNHGTHVTGVFGARHNNIGIAGLMNHVKILPLKFIGDGGGRTSDAIKALDYAVRMGARIVNCSWGGGEFSQALMDAIEAAGNQGVFVVTAAGNSKADNDKTNQYPANYKLPNVISVGATDGMGRRAKFSNFGAHSVDIFAPGAAIVSTIPGGGVDWRSGTSESAPLVTGALGLLLSIQPHMGVVEGKSLLLKSAFASPHLQGMGQSGRLDVYKMLLSAQ